MILNFQSLSNKWGLRNSLTLIYCYPRFNLAVFTTIWKFSGSSFIIMLYPHLVFILNSAFSLDSFNNSFCNSKQFNISSLPILWFTFYKTIFGFYDIRWNVLDTVIHWCSLFNNKRKEPLTLIHVLQWQWKIYSHCNISKFSVLDTAVIQIFIESMHACSSRECMLIFAK